MGMGQERSASSTEDAPIRLTLNLRVMVTGSNGGSLGATDMNIENQLEMNSLVYAESLYPINIGSQAHVRGSRPCQNVYWQQIREYSLK